MSVLLNTPSTRSDSSTDMPFLFTIFIVLIYIGKTSGTKIGLICSSQIVQELSEKHTQLHQIVIIQNKSYAACIARFLAIRFWNCCAFDGSCGISALVLSFS